MADKVRFRCEHCGKAISARSGPADKRRPCPSCKQTVRVPTPETNYRIQRSLLGHHKVIYWCQNCCAELESPLSKAGTADRCPECDQDHAIPGTGELGNEKQTAHSSNASMRSALAQVRFADSRPQPAPVASASTLSALPTDPELDRLARQFDAVANDRPSPHPPRIPPPKAGTPTQHAPVDQSSSRVRRSGDSGHAVETERIFRRYITREYMTTLWGSGVVLAILAAVATVSVTGVRWFNATSFDERLGVFGIGIGTLVLIAAALLVLRMLLEAIATFFDMAHDLHRLVAEEDDVQ